VSVMALETIKFIYFLTLSMNFFYFFLYSHLKTRGGIWDYCNCLVFETVQQL
jgi:hypothetical protein